MFENLSDRLERSFKILKGEGKITEINVAETMKDVRRALLDADVNYKVAKEFTNKVKEKALGMNVLTAVKPGQLMIKLVHDELEELMGGEEAPLKLESHPAVILMSGLQGSGKTTFSGKLANMLKTKKGKKPLLVACDVYRPAAIQQLHVVGEQVGVPVYSEPENKDVLSIADHAIQQAKTNGNDVVIVDTAGRLAIDEQMMNEISNLKNHLRPDETLFVVDSMTGQDAVNVAKEFDEKVGVDGVILSKMDGDTRGGAALSIKAVTGKPILFVSMGEKLSDLEQFYPDRMASRILGMGDVLSLIDKAQANIDIDEEKSRDMAGRMKKGKFDFEDYLESMKQMRNLGGLSSILGMLPGMGIKASDLEGAIDETQMKRTEAIVLSMTKEERRNPKILTPQRKHRIAKGAGVDIATVNRFIKQFEQTQKMMKQFGGGKKGRGGMGGMFGGGKFPGIGGRFF